MYLCGNNPTLDHNRIPSHRELVLVGHSFVDFGREGRKWADGGDPNGHHARVRTFARSPAWWTPTEAILPKSTKYRSAAFLSSGMNYAAWR